MKKLEKSSSKKSLHHTDDDENKFDFRAKCAQCLRGPKQIIRSIILLTCTVIVIYQIVECTRKIKNPPTSTYTHFDFNETIKYPAVTLCRDPPYKSHVLKKYSLIGHPRTTSEWRYFPWANATLDDFWEEATYSDEDNLINYGLNYAKDNVHVVNSLHFMHGKCQTLYPKLNMTVTNKETGFSILLNHSLNDMSETSSTIPPGYHVYIHQTDDPFVEPTTGTLVDYIYVNVGEEVDVKLSVQQVKMLVGGPKSCDGRDGYSVSECMDKCREDTVEENVKCSGPWLNLDHLPRCDNYTLIRDLIVNYIRVYENVNLECPCLSSCTSSLYSSYVVDRNHITVWNSQTKTYAPRADFEQTQIYIYFNSKTVSVYEEKHGYDWSLFIADFGGSLGFLLGLSVIGLITLLETLYDSISKPVILQGDKIEDKDKEDARDIRRKFRKDGSGRVGDCDSFSSGEYAENLSYGDKKILAELFRDEKDVDKNFYI